MPSHFQKKFRWGTVFATGRRSFIEPGTGLRMKRTNRRTRVPIGLYPRHIEEKMTIKEVKEESVMEWKTKVTTKEGVVVQFPGKFHGYKLVTAIGDLGHQRVVLIIGKDLCMTRSSTKELFTPFKDPEREFRSSRKHFKTLSLDDMDSPNFDLFFDQFSWREVVADNNDKFLIQEGAIPSKTTADAKIAIQEMADVITSNFLRCVKSKAYLDGTDTESEPFEDPIETETPESPYAVAPPTLLPESTPPTLVPILCRTACMAVRVQPAMSPGLSASMAEVTAMSESIFRKRFRSSYESSPSLSPPDLPLRKRYRDTYKLVEDDADQDEEIVESLDSNSLSEDAKDEGPTAEDEDPATEDEGEKEEAVPEGQQRAVPVMGTTVSAPLGLGYGALRRQELALEEDHVYSTFEVGQGSGSAPEPERPERVSASRQPTLTTWTGPEDAPSIVPLPVSSPMIPLTVPSLVATPATAKTEGFLTELEAQVEMQGGLIRNHAVRAVRDEIFSQRYRFRSLKHEQERVALTFGAIWRPVLALESWAGQTDAQRAALWHAISDTQGENWELRLQLTEERRVRLELTEIVDSMRRGQEP
ncbi:hypothetical protein Tco_0402163 [Tanacetum coccineum]